MKVFQGIVKCPQQDVNSSKPSYVSNWRTNSSAPKSDFTTFSCTNQNQVNFKGFLGNLIEKFTKKKNPTNNDTDYEITSSTLIKELTDKEFEAKKVGIKAKVDTLPPNIKEALKYVNVLTNKYNIFLVESIIANPQLFENKDFTANIKFIIYDTATKENAKSKIDLINKIGQNHKLFENKSFTDSIGYLIYDTDSAKKAEARTDFLDRIANEDNIKNYNLGKILFADSKENINAKFDIDKMLTNKQAPEQIRDYFLKHTYAKNKESILKQISKINPNVEFLNLNHEVGKEYFSVNRLNNILIQFPKTNRKLGRIPDGWLNNVPKSEQRTTAPKIYDTLADFATSSDNNKEEIFAQKLSELLQQKVSIKYIYDGSFGTGYKVKINKKLFLLKTFKGRGESYKDGAGIEQQNGLYSNRNARAKQFTKFYFGKVAGSIYSDGFMVNEFLEPNTKRATKPKKQNPIVSSKPLYLDFVSSDDFVESENGSEAHNTINGRIFDFGDYTINESLKDQKLRQDCRIFGERIYQNKYQDGSVKKVMNKKNEQILYDYAKKNMSKSEFDAALSMYETQLAQGSDVRNKLQNIRKNLYGDE